MGGVGVGVVWYGLGMVEGDHDGDLCKSIGVWGLVVLGNTQVTL